ncbi:unnamed protein product, partial [Staurois parvus]
LTVAQSRSVYTENRGGLTIWKLGTAQGPGVSRGPHEMPLVLFS